MKKKYLIAQDSINLFNELGGGKALGLKKLYDCDINVPPFFVITHKFFDELFNLEHEVFQVKENFSAEKMQENIEIYLNTIKFNDEQWNMIDHLLESNSMRNCFLAIRSSGHDEDSKLHSFAGQFLSFLFQKTKEDIEGSIKECFRSAYSERVLMYRLVNKLDNQNIKMSVVVQKMINSECAGVAFSHNPINLSDRKNILIESVFGQGEGLVGGYFDADQFLFDREKLIQIQKKIGPKDKMFAMAPKGGIEEIDIPKSKLVISSIDDQNVFKIAAVCKKLLELYKYPIDIEWAIEENQLYILQMRPITNLPPESIFEETLMGGIPILWDNSNIVESFSGVTTPLTFSYAKVGYDTVYRICCDLIGVPKNVLDNHKNAFEHMLGQINGRVYYNLLNWYSVLFLMPGSSTSKGFMETMLGVKDNLDDSKKQYFDLEKKAPQYSLTTKLKMYSKLIYQFLIVDRTVDQFMHLHKTTYDELDEVDFNNLSLQEIDALYRSIEKKILLEWKAPIINDFLVMIFFGSLRKLTEKWIPKKEGQNEIQNDLLCGEGDIISTRPTKDLMAIASWFDQTYPDDSLTISMLSIEEVQAIVFKNKKYPDLSIRFEKYIKDFGFRCSNEQKLEEMDLHEDPSMAISNFITYLKNKKYSVEEMEINELKIRKNAENIVNENLSGIKKIFFSWVLKNARKAVRNRENLRFARTRSYGLSRRIFRSIGDKFYKLEILNEPRDIFFLSISEIFDIIHGVSVTSNVLLLAELRKKEYHDNLLKNDPPERFITVGAAAPQFNFPMLLSSLDLLKDKFIQTDPNVFQGISCSPGIVSGTLLVAKNIEDAKKINGEILLAYRTDPGWVPLYPNCKGLAIERGSLLSHSAVVAREMGLPTIVGLNGSPVKKLKSGVVVELNATKGILVKRDYNDKKM
jgi:pyruvate,water dikinase